MNFVRYVITLLIALTLLVSVAQVYSVSAFTATQQERSAHSNKPARFRYVCPMHEDVASNKPGTCPKCKMKLVRKPLPARPSQ